MRIFWHPKENLILKRLLFRLNAPTPNVFIINFSRLVSGMLRLVSGISLLVNWEIDVNRKLSAKLTSANLDVIQLEIGVVGIFFSLCGLGCSLAIMDSGFFGSLQRRT
ncbi:uncharacterized protein LOC113321067 isoform X4 [Papaver somniferum]|nr:uncharacterized protein LOC113321067 isoform X4 [Papaver somniferum]XP_026424735.1 uncharacterized protein LOC113321067 isoform X4 [Papaver somniferum]XP_026424736.1 uncharacterized protein LOC113321067 isoform X4 [Papaver somniferum]XP_026424737.1 uncharacterized protein LOC113321067 isoform X4 [Papaver somniferum]